MPALPNRVLRAKLAGALPEGTVFETGPEEVHPAIATVPGFGRVRFYLWTVTPDRSAAGRPAGELKIQLILPDQAKNQRASFDFEGAHTHTALLGYSPDFGVFVGWEPKLYGSFRYSSNVQCREEHLKEGRNTGWAVAPPRQLRGSGREEVRVAFTPGNLPHYLRVSRDADREGREGKWREVFFLMRTPNVPGSMPARARDLEESIEKQRERVAASRLRRDATFSPKVKKEYAYSCAVCTVQLEIVEGAHIIPVRESGSSDEVWNGVALCPNHHQLYDGKAFVIRPDLKIRIDAARVEYFEENDLAQGIELLTDFDGESIRPPDFWGRDASLRARMASALTRHTAGAGLE